MMQGDQGDSASSRVRSDYARLAESLEADMMKHPYADRAPPPTAQRIQRAAQSSEDCSSIAAAIASTPRRAALRWCCLVGVERSGNRAGP